MLNYKLPDDQTLIQEMLFSDLSLEAQTLFAQLCRLEYGNLILYFLHSCASTQLTLDDLAYHLHQPLTHLEKDLRALERLGLVQATRIIELTFYGITSDLAKLRLLRELWNWQTQWDSRIDAMQRLIWGDHLAATRHLARHTHQNHFPMPLIDERNTGVPDAGF